MPQKKVKWLTKGDIVALTCLVAVAVFLVIKAPYGFGYYDESFYLATARRFAQGDAMVAQEWNLAQMFTLFTALPAALYEGITGSTDGMLLAFRYLYIAVQGVAAVFVYARLHRLGRPAATFAAASFFLFAPYGIGALSYNSMGVLFMVLAGVILATMQTRKHVQTAVAGALYAGAVLCCPFLALGWLGLAVVAFVLRKKQPAYTRGVLAFTGGVAALAAVFFVFVFSRTGPILFLKGVRTMLQSTDRSSEAFGQGLLFCTPAAPYLFAAFAVLYLLLWRDKKRDERAPHYLAVGCVLVLIFQLSFELNTNTLNFWMFAINLVAPLALLCRNDAAGRRVLVFLWGPGLFYALAISLASNQRFYALSAASSVAAVAAVLLLTRAMPSFFGAGLHRAAALLLTGTLLAAQLGGEAVMRWEDVFWQGEPDTLTVLLAEGVQKGIYTDEATAAEYTSTLADTAPLRSLGAQDTVAFISRKSWLYLTTPARLGSFSSWLQLGDGIREKTKDQLTLYYDRYPEKLPTALYIEGAFADVKDLYCGYYGYTAEETANGWILSGATA